MDIVTYVMVTNVHVYSRPSQAHLHFVNQEVRVGVNDPRKTGVDVFSNPICDTMPIDIPCSIGHYIFHCNSSSPLQGRYVTINLVNDTLDPDNPHLLVLSELEVFIKPNQSSGQNACPNSGKSE